MRRYYAASRLRYDGSDRHCFAILTILLGVDRTVAVRIRQAEYRAEQRQGETDDRRYPKHQRIIPSRRTAVTGNHTFATTGSPKPLQSVLDGRLGRSGLRLIKWAIADSCGYSWLIDTHDCKCGGFRTILIRPLRSGSIAGSPSRRKSPRRTKGLISLSTSPDISGRRSEGSGKG